MADQIKPDEGLIFESADCKEKLVRLEKLARNYSSYGEIVLERCEVKHPDKVIWVSLDI